MSERSVVPSWEGSGVSAGSLDQFDYTAVVYGDFESLYEGVGGESIPDDRLVDLIFRRGRALLQAPAGAGKTSLLLRVKSAIGQREDHAARVISLGELPALLGGELHADAIASWLNDEIRAEAVSLLLMLDGLDELPPHMAHAVLAAVDQVTGSVPGCAVLVSDRLGRRPVRVSRWALLGLSLNSVQPQLLQRAGQSVEPWMRLPFYLRLLQSGANSSEQGLVIKEYLLGALASDATALDQLAEAILEWSHSTSTRLVDRNWLASRVGIERVDLMESSGMLESSSRGNTVQFHILVHGYLTAHAIADRPAAWRPDIFEALTAGGGNYVALDLLLGQVQAATTLVRAVDNWNFYASGHLLAEDFRGDRRIADDIRSALLLMLGLRRHSQVLSTKLQVEDVLRLHGGSLASDILNTEDEQALVSLAINLPVSGNWWSDWLSVFSLARAGEGSAEDVSAAISSSDGLIGWAAANVVANRSLSGEERDALTLLARSSRDDVVRWRSIHALGGANDFQSVQVCLTIFRADNSVWVKYGALRSALAIASHLPNASDRNRVFVELALLAETLASNAKWKREIERAVRIVAPPDGWSDDVGVLVEQLWALAESVEEQDRWRSLSAQLRTGWRDLRDSVIT
jgi:hypothetical protein